MAIPPNQPDPPTPPPIWRPAHWALLAVLLSIAAGVGWWTRAPEVGIGGDEAHFILLSRSLEDGHYRDVLVPNSPPHAQYPPGNPAWIAAVRLLAGPDLEALRAANIALLILTALLVGDGVRRLGSPWLGVAAAGLVAFNTLLLPLAGTGLSEIPYATLVALSMWAALRADQSRTQRGWTILASLAAIAAFLTRTAGVAAFAGIGLWLLWQRRWVAAAAHAMFALLVLGAWSAYAVWAASTMSGLTYARDLAVVGGVGGGGLAGLPYQALHHAKYYLLEGLPGAFPAPTIPGTMLDNLAWLALLGGPGVLGVVASARLWPAVPAYLLFAAGLLLSWPWTVDRLLAPVLPQLIAVLVLGWQAPITRFPRVMAVLASSVFLTMGAFGLQQTLAQDQFRHCDRTDPYNDPTCFRPTHQDLVHAVWFVRDSLPSSVIIGTTRPQAVQYFAGVRAFQFRPALERAMESGEFSLPETGADLVLLAQTMRENIDDARILLRHCRSLAVRASPAPSVLVLAPKEANAPGEDACAALSRFINEGERRFPPELE